MEVDKEVKVEDQIASIAKTSASSSKKIKTEINPYLTRLTSARKVQLKILWYPFIPKTVVQKMKSIMQKQTGLH